MNGNHWPTYAVWDITYACPLRCTHCYSESGRRPSRQLSEHDLMRVVDALVSMRLKLIVLSGGEPLLVKEIFRVAERIVRAGIAVHIYTSGWQLEAGMLDPLMTLFQRIGVSLDGATPDVHDRIRGRRGSFDRALHALERLDTAVSERRRCGADSPWLGIEYTVTRSNMHQVRALCSEIVGRYPSLSYVTFGGVIPSGLATRPSFVEHEMLTELQAAELADGLLRADLQKLVGSRVSIGMSDNRNLQLHPDLLAKGIGIPGMQIEADGMVRAMSSYEGTVGSLLLEAPDVLWARAVRRWKDPFVLEALTPARTLAAWAEATRRIDVEYGSELVRDRIARRPAYQRAEDEPA